MRDTRLFLIAGLIMTASLAHGSLVAPQSLLYLQRQADLIVVGTHANIVQTGAKVSFSVQISRVLKGDSGLLGSAIAVEWPTASASAQTETSATDGVGIWFLQRVSGGWLLLPVIQGNVPLAMTYFPAPSGAVLGAYAYTDAASLSDKVAAELSFAIEACDGTYPTQLSYLMYDLLDQLNSPYVSALYTRMSNSTSMAQQILGLGGLVRGGSSAALASAIESASVFAAQPGNGILLLSIRDQFRAADVGSIALLGKASLDSANLDIGFRRATAHALAAIHTAATLPYLASLLDDQDLNLRVEGIGGIGSFANGLATQTSAGVPSLAFLQYPASAPYMTAETKAHFALGVQAIGQNEAAYLSFWRQWWSQHRTGLGF
jgi:hypothetical protein